MCWCAACGGLQRARCAPCKGGFLREGVEPSFRLVPGVAELHYRKWGRWLGDAAEVLQSFAGFGYGVFYYGFAWDLTPWDAAELDGFDDVVAGDGEVLGEAGDGELFICARVYADKVGQGKDGCGECICYVARGDGGELVWVFNVHLPEDVASDFGLAVVELVFGGHVSELGRVLRGLLRCSLRLRG